VSPISGSIEVLNTIVVGPTFWPGAIASCAIEVDDTLEISEQTEI
jgi:hypothetical protein